MSWLQHNRDLLHLFFYTSLVTLALQLKNGHNVNSLMECLVVTYIPILEKCNSITLLEYWYGRFRVDVDRVFTALGCPGMVNMGDSLSWNTYLIL